MNISMIKKKSIDKLSKQEKKDLHITKITHENGIKCVELFNRNGAYRGFSKKTNKALKKALSKMRKVNKNKAA